MAEDAADPPPMEEVWSPPVPDPSKDPENEIRAIARKLSEQPVLNPEPGVWAVLTAISKNARQRPQGINIILSADEHCLGRCVEDLRFQVGEITVSAYHCRIFRERKATVDDEQDPSLSVSVFLKDTSTNGTFLNWEKLRRRSPKAKLCHGDIISFSAPPHEANSYAFVYREVRKPTSNVNGSSLKRKSEDLAVENKRQKGIGIGAPDGPISLDDVRSLQRSNTELRQQLEAQVRTIETTRCEYRACVTRHENDLKEMKDTLSSSFLDQIKDLRTLLDGKQKELDELNSSSAQLRQSIKDLNERLTVSMQSRSDADEIIQSQKAIISELESQLDEERNQRREEREKAAIDLKSALQKVHSEAQEEIKRQADVYLRQHKEQQEVINKLQESEKESRLLVETLRSKLEDARENLVVSEKRVRHLEVQLQDEQTTSAKSKKKSETLDLELKRLRKELENEKVAREEAWAKVSALELEIAAAIRDLSIEKQRFQGARERIILRETQLRAFYSTTEEISSLFAKQQEQLKAMQKTLEDEENCDAASFGINLNELPTGNPNMAHVNARDTREASGACTPKNARTMCGSSHDDDDDDASVTEKHNCDPRSHEGNTQDLECTSADRLVEEIGADMGGISTAVVPDGGLMDTECIVETESPACDASFHLQNAALNKCRDLAGDTVQLDDEAQVQCKSATPSKQLEERNYPGSQSRIEDTQPVTIRTTDLLASEVAGSWAISTAPSVHGENESPKSAGHGGVGGEAADAATLVPCSEGQVEGSQSNAKCPGAKVSAEHQALNVMIEIMAPNLRQRLSGGSSFHVERNDSMSDAETEGSNHSPEGVNETQNANGSDGGGGGGDDDDARSLSTNNTVEDDTEDAEENSDDMIEDSVG